MNETIARLLNEQINKEFYSAYLYLDMANYYDSLDLDGYANYYMIQAQEERDHALLFMKYMQNNGLKVTLEAIGKPEMEDASILDPLVAAAGALCDCPDQCHLPRGPRGPGLPHHEVPGLVCGRADGGGRCGRCYDQPL